MVHSLKLKMKEQKGFTLIELLAVIVILGIIAAIAIPAIGNVITKSDNKAKVQDALLIINAAKLYVADNRPTGATTLLTKSATTPGTGETATLSNTGLADYLERVKDDGFTVTVTYTDTTGKYSYTIKDHDACVLASTDKKEATPVDEKTLTNFKQ